MKLQVFAYAAGAGDCIHVRYQGESMAWHNIIIDSGVASFMKDFRRIYQAIQDQRESLDMMIITHQDADHLGGLLQLLRSGYSVSIGTVILNPPYSDTHCDLCLSAAQNSDLYARLQKLGISVREAKAGDIIYLDGMKIDILLPTERIQLDSSKIHTQFDKHLKYHRDYRMSLKVLMDHTLPSPDRSESNHSSIVCVMEYLDKRLLFTGDAWGESLAECLKDFHSFDLIKMPHHGSVRNLHGKWLNEIKCSLFLITADGLQHPDKQTIAVLLHIMGSITIVSPVAWWKKDFFVQADKEYLVSKRLKLFLKNGLVISWN